MTTERTGEPPRGRSEKDGPDPRMLEIIVCPLTKTSLELDADRGELISRAARLAYPIRDGIPLMTQEAARPLEDDEGGAKGVAPGPPPAGDP